MPLSFFAACAHADDDLFSGTVQADSAAVGSPVGGRVTAVLAVDGDRVRAREAIVRFNDAQQRATLDAADHDAAAAAAALADLLAGAREPDLARARDQLRQARETYEQSRLAQARQIAVLRGQLAQARAQLADVRATADEAARDAARARALASTGDVSTQARDSAVARATSLRADVAAAVAGVANARNQLRNAADVTLPRTTAADRAAADAARNAYLLLSAGSRPDLIRQARASLAAARATAANAAAHLDDTIVRAPAAGTISAFDLHVGDLIAPNATVATIDEDGEPFVRVYVPQARLDRVILGARVRVRPDAQPGIVLDGTVEQIDSQAQFTPQNVQTADDRAALSFGVKVRIHDREHRVRGGTTVAVAFQ